MLNEEKTKALSDELADGVLRVFRSNRLGQYLRAASLFRGYSPRNAALIFFQKPDATYVAGYDEWKKLGRYVRRGETGISIFAPVRAAEKTEKPILDDEGNPVPDENGSTKKETESKTRIRFRPAAVFDVSQTDGDPVPSLCLKRQSAVSDSGEIFEALQKVSPYRIVFENLPGGEPGRCFRAEKKIVLRSGMNDGQIVETLIREFVRASLAKEMSPERKKIETEGIAFLVSDFLGADTSGCRFGSVSVWSQRMDTAELQEMLEEIQNGANGIISRVEGAVKNIEKETAHAAQKLPERLLEAVKISERLGAEKEVTRNAKLRTE